MRGGAYFWGLAVPPPQGEGPRRSSILGVPFYLCVRRTIKFGIHMGKGLVFMGPAMLLSQVAELPHFHFLGFSSIYAYTLLRRTITFGKVTRWEGRVF